MAITNQERVGKAMELLHQGLGAFVEREFRNLHKAKAGAEALRYAGDLPAPSDARQAWIGDVRDLLTFLKDGAT